MRNSSKGAFWAAVFLGLCAFSGLALFGMSQRLYRRLDLTQDKAFTLSQTTLDLLSQLNGPLDVKLYRTQDLQGEHLETAQRLVDALEEYKRHSGGYLNLSIADPTDEAASQETRDALQKEAQGFGIQSFDDKLEESDKATVRRIYLGVAMNYNGRQETLPTVTNGDALEYDITQSLKRLINGAEATKPVIGFLSGHGEPNVVGQLKQLFSDEREYRNIRLDKPIADDVDALVILTDPHSGAPPSLTDGERFYLDQFVMHGHPLIIFLATIAQYQDKNQQPQQQPMPIFQPVQTGLEELLAGYGIKTTGDIVLDPKYDLQAQVGVRQTSAGGFSFPEPVYANHPLFLVANQLSKDSPLVKGLGKLVLPEVTGLDLSDARAKGFTVEELVKSSEASYRRKLENGLLIAAPNQLAQPAAGDIPGPAVLVASVSGTFPSFFAGKPTPDLTPKPQQGQPPQSAPASLPARLDVAQDGARVLVIGTGAVAYFQAKDKQNLIFLHNLLDWSVLDTSMMEIRARGASAPPLTELEPGKKSLIKWLNILGIPLLLALFGVVRWQLRRKRSEA